MRKANCDKRFRRSLHSFGKRYGQTCQVSSLDINVQTARQRRELETTITMAHRFVREEVFFVGKFRLRRKRYRNHAKICVSKRISLIADLCICVADNRHHSTYQLEEQTNDKMPIICRFNITRKNAFREQQISHNKCHSANHAEFCGFLNGTLTHHAPTTNIQSVDHRQIQATRTNLCGVCAYAVCAV